MSDFNKFPKDVLIQILTTVQEHIKSDYEEELSILKEEINMIKKLGVVQIYHCSHGKCKAMISVGERTHSCSSCESFSWCNCVEDMSLPYCNVHTCKTCHPH